MQPNDILPGLAIVAALVAFAALVRSVWPFYRELTASGGPNKFESLDGLRAYLALGVFLHHSLISHHWMKTGDWEAPPNSAFYEFAGPAAVTIFFMITGFLFWTKAIRGGGSIPHRQFLIGRVLRVGPMYLAISAMVYGTLLFEKGLDFGRGPVRLLAGVVSPFTLGLIQWKRINAIDPLTLNAQVNWTLQYEWYFYLALPVLAFLATPRRFSAVAVIVVAIFVAVNPWPSFWPAIMFLYGMAIAHLIVSIGPIRTLSGPLACLACLGLIGLIPWVTQIPPATGRWAWNTIFAFVLLCVLSGNTMFAALTTAGARVLGSISYSIYLSHGFMLYLGRALMLRWVAPESLSPGHYWAFVALTGLATVLLSLVTYRWVEHPFIAYSHRLGRRSSSAPRPAEQPSPLPIPATEPA